MALLFPSSDRSSTGFLIDAVLSRLRKRVVLGPEHDRILHAIRSTPLEPHERDIRNFHYWHDRIVVLKQAFDEAPPTHTFAQLWYDRRDSRQWYTFWSVILLGVLSLWLSVAQALLAALQYRKTLRILHIVVDDESVTEPLLAR